MLKNESLRIFLLLIYFRIVFIDCYDWNTECLNKIDGPNDVFLESIGIESVAVEADRRFEVSESLLSPPPSPAIIPRLIK